MKIIDFLLTGFLLIAQSNAYSQHPVKLWQDTPTPAEMALHNQPYIILQKEIEENLCNNDWEIDSRDKNGDDVAPFLILKGDPGDDVIARGTSVHNFIPVDRGIACTVQLKSSSPLYTANNDSMRSQSGIWQAQYNLANQLFEKAAKNNYKYTSEDSAVMKKMKIASDNATLEMARLSKARKLATIAMQLNSSWTEPQKGRQYYLDGGTDFDAGKKLPPVKGAAYATLFTKKPWKNDPDTLCEATVYIGNWPVQTDIKKRFAFHFVHTDKTPWTDKQHSGQPFLENMKIIITAESYEKVMKVIDSIEWTKLEALVKN